MTSTSPYIPPHEEGMPWGFDVTPEFSRRSRGLPVYAALRFLGRRGVAELVDRCCDHARRMAARLSAAEGVDVLNDVVLNQVVVRFADDETTAAVIDAVQRTPCWLSGSSFQGEAVMRISVGAGGRRPRTSTAQRTRSWRRPARTSEKRLALEGTAAPAGINPCRPE